MRQHRWSVWLVTDVYPPDCGGSGWSTHALARTLLSHGHRTSVIAMDPACTEVTHRRFEDVEVTEVGVRSGRRSPRRRLGARDYAYDILTRYLARRLSTEPDVDILHAQHLHSGPPTVDVGRAHARATIVTIRDYWPVCLHGTSWWGGTICDGCTTSGLTGCMTEYWHWPRPAARLMVGWARRRLSARQRGVADAHRVLAVSDAVRRRIASDLPGVHLSVVPNMVDPERLDVAASSLVVCQPKTPYLLTAGKLVPTKGFDLLLSALAEVSSGLPLVVAGDGPMKETLDRQARGLGLDVRFRGWVAHDELLRLQRDARAVVIPSAWNEPLSRLILETLGLGTPVIAWARGGTPEIIDSGSNGWLVETPADLGAALGALESDDRRRQVGLAGRARVMATYAPNVVYPAMQGVYAAALAEVGRG